MAHTLNISTDTFDQDNTFAMEVPGFKKTIRITASLHKDYQKQGDGIFWALKKSACLKAQYTVKDDEERTRLNNMLPLQANQIVIIEGKEYKVRVLGNFSDCAIFDPA